MSLTNPFIILHYLRIHNVNILRATKHKNKAGMIQAYHIRSQSSMLSWTQLSSPFSFLTAAVTQLSISWSALVPGTNTVLKWPRSGHFKAVVLAGTCLWPVMEYGIWAISQSLVIRSFLLRALWKWHSRTNKSPLLDGLVSQAVAHFLPSPPYTN